MRLRSTRLVSYGRGRTAWTPERLSTALWLDAADSSTVTLNGSTVSQWNDKSRNGRNAVQATAANQPVWGVGRNLLLWSDEFDNAAWTKQGVSITQNSGIAPDGTLTADKIIPNTTAGVAHVVFNAAAVSVVNGVATWTVRAKAAEYNFVTLGAVVPAGRYSATFNLTTGATTKTDTAGSPTSTGNSAKQLANGWWELSITATTTTAAASYILLGASSSGTPTQDGSLKITDAGDGASGVLLWGAQITPEATADAYQQTTSAAQTVATGINGTPTLTFDGTDDFLSVDGTWAVGTPYHIAAVVMRTSNKSNNSLWGGTGGTANSSLIAGWATDTTYRNAQYGNDFSVTVPAYTTPTPLIAGHDLNLVSGRTQYFDGTLAGSRADTATLLSNAGWRLGNWVNFFNGRMGEIVATPYSLSTADRQRLEGYLAWKWGLEANLPSNHPYKLLPPTV